MADSEHLRFAKVTDPEHRQRICDHYKFDLHEVDEVYCAMGTHATDPRPPLEVLVHTAQQNADYEMRLAAYEDSEDSGADFGDDEPERYYTWAVRYGRIWPGMFDFPADTLDAANKQLLFNYSAGATLRRVFDVEPEDLIGTGLQSLGLAVRAMREDPGIETGYLLMTRDTTDSEFTVVLRANGEDMPVADALKASAVRAACSVVLATRRGLRDRGENYDGRQSVMIALDGIIGIEIAGRRCIFAVDAPNVAPRPAPDAEVAPEI